MVTNSATILHNPEASKAGLSGRKELGLFQNTRDYYQLKDNASRYSIKLFVKKTGLFSEPCGVRCVAVCSLNPSIGWEMRELVGEENFPVFPFYPGYYLGQLWRTAA